MFWVYLVGAIVAIKFIVLGFVAWRLPDTIKDDGGPVSGWGTPEG